MTQMRMTRIDDHDDAPDLSLTPLSSISTVLASSWTVRFTLQTCGEDKWPGHNHDTHEVHCQVHYSSLAGTSVLYWQ